LLVVIVEKSDGFVSYMASQHMKDALNVVNWLVEILSGKAEDIKLQGDTLGFIYLLMTSFIRWLTIRAMYWNTALSWQSI